MTARYPDFAFASTEAGDPRRTGVEIEFAGLGEVRAAEIVGKILGGTVRSGESHEMTVTGTSLGDITVELDTMLRKRKDIPLLEMGLDMAKGLVPVEIITPPLTRAEMPMLDELVGALRDAGATGTRDGIMLGFGVHLNPEVVAHNHMHTLNTILAFGLLEPWLRRKEDLDITRRMMPYVSVWPWEMVAQMARERPKTLSELMKLMAPRVQSRNHGLDLFPLFAHAEPKLYKQLFTKPGKTSARPTFHFRMPDCRIDEADWSLAQSWRLWATVESVADAPALLDSLSAAWLDHMHRAPGADSRWSSKVDALLTQHAMEPAP